MIKKIIKKIIDSYILLECSLIRVKKNDGKKRLLILRKDALGDFVIFLPLIKYYREHYAGYTISLIVSPPSAIELRSIFDYIDEIRIFDKNLFGRNFLYRRSFFRYLKKKNFDVAIYPVYSRESMGDLMIKVTNAKERITFKRDSTPADSCYTQLIQIPEKLNEHEINCNFFSSLTGTMPEIHFPTISLETLDKSKYFDIKKEFSILGKKYVILFPGSGNHMKNWPVDKYSLVAKYLIQKGLSVVMCGSKNESYLAEKIICSIGTTENIIDLCGKTDIPTLAHIIGNSIFYFGSDTGPMHISAALDIPTICIMGGGTFARFFPYGNLEKNRIVFDKNMKCRDDLWRCLQDLKKGESAPCVRNISIEFAIEEINIILKYINDHQKNS